MRIYRFCYSHNFNSLLNNYKSTVILEDAQRFTFAQSILSYYLHLIASAYTVTISSKIGKLSQ